MDNFLVEQVLGKGGFGTVLKCLDQAKAEHVAIKKFAKLDHTYLKKFIAREYTLIVGMKHNNVTKVLSHFHQKGRLHLVFELLDHSIKDDIKESQPDGLKAQVLRRYLFQTLQGMEYLHNVNIIHRDIKPDNLLVSGSGVVKVADLGCCCEVRDLDCSPVVDLKICGNRQQGLTTPVGTPWFLSPEMLTTDRYYSKATDVWSLGCTILKMATSKYFLCGRSYTNHLFQIVSKVGPLTPQQHERFCKEHPSHQIPVCRLPSTNLRGKYNLCDYRLAQLVEACLQTDPGKRATCSQLLGHPYFTWDGFHQSFPQELEKMVQADRDRVLLSQIDLPLAMDSGEANSEKSPEIPAPSTRGEEDSIPVENKWKKIKREYGARLRTHRIRHFFTFSCCRRT